MGKPPYYSKVVEKLLNYKEYKQRIKKIEMDREEKPTANMGMDYSSPAVSGGGGKSDSTGNKAIEIIEDIEDEEYKKKCQVVRDVEIAFEGLCPLEQFVVYKKYMQGRKKPDVKIYTHPEFGPERTKYYEIKDEAIKKMARIMGIISE